MNANNAQIALKTLLEDTMKTRDILKAMQMF